jgi:histidine triad (HIT) family protein
VLVVPRKPIARVGEATTEDQATLGHLLLVAAQLSRQLNLAKGFRIVINNGPDGGESVPHLHVHLLGGRALSWPPG